MPLMNKKPFKRIKPPKDLDPNEELFYLQATHEVFREYDDFFERVIMCNSLVWSCELTGKSNLTFQEATKSEEDARQSLRTFPIGLRKLVLYLAALTARKRLNDMCDDVFNYVKDRFFIGEEVEVSINGVKKSSEVTQVILPDRTPKSPAKAETSKQRKQKDISPSKIKYEVVNMGTGKTSVVKQENLSRPKGSYNKPRNKLFLKNHTEPRDGIWKVKESVFEKEQLEEYPFSEVFCGPLPAYVAPAENFRNSIAAEKTPRKTTEMQGKRQIQGKLNFKKESEEEKRKSISKQTLVEKQRLAAEKERQKIKEDEKEKQKMDKINERLKRKEEKRVMAEYLLSWKKPRDDLECDDLKELPATTPIECGVPQSCFGDALMVLEFLNTFEKQIEVKDNFPHGFTFEHIERALSETDIQGVLNDLLQLFLAVLFRHQEAEDDVRDTKDRKIETLDDLSIEQAMDVAAIATNWPKKFQGTLLRNIPMDSFSLTEILRLHILSSGARHRVNWQGIVAPSEDPGVYFKMEEAELLKKLSQQTVFELNAEERCKVLVLLMHQLLASDVIRYAVDENADKTRPLKVQLKQLRWAYMKKEKEDVLGKKKPAQEDKAEGNTEGKDEGKDSPAAVNDEEKENTDNMSPEEKAAFEEKKSKEALRQKAEFLRKEKEIEVQIKKLQNSFNVAPLGKDRSFRRYWVFQTVAGVFIEDEDPFKGSCLSKPTVQVPNPQAANNNNNMKSEVTLKKYLQQMDNGKTGSSDKENDILKDIAMVQSGLPPLKNRKLSDLNQRVDAKKGGCVQCQNTKVEQESPDLVRYCPHSKNLNADQCSANLDNCPVHNQSAPRMMWSFYYKEEDLNGLISSLNARGFRERALKEALVNEKERLAEMMGKTPYYAFNRSLPCPPQPEVRKSQRHQTSQSSEYAGMAPHVANESILRDMILELEVRIFAGGLGSLKVPDRDAWRAALEKGTVDLVGDIVKLETNGDVKDIAMPSPSSTEETVKDLALALLQISQGIESRYLNDPLGESAETKKAKLKSPDIPRRKTFRECRLEKWQQSLPECSSISQLFLHLGTLERSVAWSRSVLKAHCRICRKRGDPETMLLCDGCNRGHHMYCLKPPLKEIPEGDWFCVSCKPIEVPASPKKKRAEEEHEVGSDDEEEESEEEEEDDEEEEEEESGSEEEAEITVQESCEACGDVGTLLCCDKCPLMYHAECVNLKRIPRGEWLCPKCTKKDEALKRVQKHPTSGNYGTRSNSLTTDTKKTKKNHLKNTIGAKERGTKRRYEDSFEEEFEPPKKKSNRESRSSAGNSEKVNPFKRVYKDSSRRRDKWGGESDVLDYKTCIDLLVELMRHPSAWPFLVPVSKKDVPEYHQVIKRPMDFGTIRSKLNFMNYQSNEEFVRDLFLVLQNCEWFNPKASEEYKAAQVLYKEVKKLLLEYQLCTPLAITNMSNVNDS